MVGFTLCDLTGAHDVEELLEQGEVDEPPIDDEDPTVLDLEDEAS